MRLLESLGEKYIFEKGFLTEIRFFLVDFYLPKPRKLCIEIDGGCHVGREKYDAERDEFLRTKRKLRIVHLSNQSAFSLNPDSLLRIITASAPGLGWHARLGESEQRERTSWNT